MSAKDDPIKRIRGELDALDRELLALLSRRGRLAQEIGAVKEEQGRSDHYRPEREVEVLRALAARNEGPIADEHLAHVFREIISACRALELSLGVAFLGPEGTFTEAAAYKHFGHAIHPVPAGTIDGVFREVESGACDFGVVPVENSTEGVVSHTLDMFVSSTLSICGEVELRIHHCLMSNAGSLGEVRKVYSHQQSLAQCRRWLDGNLPNVEREAVSSNAEAARRASGEAGAAAIAGEVAAGIHGLALLATNVEDDPNNTTRFLVVGHQSVPATGSDKTSVLFTAKNRPGALYDLLESFKRRGISMTRIESRPSRSGLWQYIIFVDFEGHADDENVARALEEIEEHASLFKVLGSYPRTTSWVGE